MTAPIILFMSHRWHDRDVFDDHFNSKTRIACSITRYNKTLYKRDAYWWIDYTCIDQENVVPFIAALPLYIAAAEEVISIYNPRSTYDKRGWIRCERALSAALNSPRAWKIIPPNLFDRYSQPDTEWWLIEDPSLGECSFPHDQPFLDNLSSLAVRLWPLGFNSNWHAAENNYASWGYQPRLVYGNTRIFTWCMNYYANIRLT